MEKKAPIRSCVVCRRQSDKGDLIRIVRGTDGAVDVDPKGRKPGRGAYVCANTDCIRQLEKGNRLGKALRCTVPAEIIKKLEELLPQNG